MKQRYRNNSKRKIIKKKEQPHKSFRRTQAITLAEQIVEFINKRKGEVSKNAIFSNFPPRFAQRIKKELSSLVDKGIVIQKSANTYYTGASNIIDEIEKIIFAKKFDDKFKELDADEITSIATELNIKDFKKRKDYRGLAFVTIDGEDARDFDDAIFTQKTAGGFKLFVAISDVAHYVNFGSKLDQAVASFGTSVYFPHRAVHMMPDELAANICSLLPHRDRLVLCVEIEFSKTGIMRKYSIFEGVIRTHARLTYDEVKGYLETGSASEKFTDDIKNMLSVSYELSSKLRERRFNQGSLDFNFPEARIKIADNKVVSIAPFYNHFAHHMIEEFMLSANRAVAMFALENNIPVIFRVHDEPSQEGIEDVIALATRLTGKTYNADLKSLSRLLKDIKGQSAERAIHSLLLRSQAQAHYSEKNNGHYALAFEEYLHFTSPIRRYPDLMVHRGVKAFLNNAEYGVTESYLKKLSEKLSEDERKAMEAEREANDLCAAFLMRDQINKTFKGKVTSVLDFGCFVEILDEGYFVQGLLPAALLPPDFYEFKAELQMLIGRRTNIRFKLGNILELKCADVNLTRRQISFAFIKNLTAAKSSIGKKG